MRCPSGHPCVAAVLDLAMSPLARLRPKVVGEARGRVLELGVGTGLNFAHYGDDVESVTGIEPDPHMLRRAAPRAQAARVPVSLHQVGAESMQLDGHYDTLVLTWVLCTIPDVAAALERAVAHLRPGAQVLWVEHTASPHAVLAAGQRVVDPLWTRLAGGCHLTREPVAALEAAGVASLEVRPCGSTWSPVPVFRGVGRVR